MSLYDRVRSGKCTYDEHQVFIDTWYNYKGDYNHRKLKRQFNKNWKKRKRWIYANRAS